MDLLFSAEIIYRCESQDKKGEGRWCGECDQCRQRADHSDRAELSKRNTAEDELQHKDAEEKCRQEIEVDPNHHDQFAGIENGGSPDKASGIDPFVGLHRRQRVERCPAMAAKFHQRDIRLKAGDTELIFK